MIKVTIEEVNNQFHSLIVKGHAKSDEQGKDLVCAGVSCVVTGGFNNLQGIKDYEYELNEGLAFLKVDKLLPHDEVVVETIICSLKTIEEQFPQFIHIQTNKK